MVAEGADILDIGAESTRPYGGAVAVSLDEELRAARAGAARGGGARRSGLDRHHASRRSPPGRSRPARRSSTTSGACSAIPTWRASSPSTRRAGRHHAQPRHRRSGDRHHGRHHGVLHALARRSPSAPASRASTSCSIPASASARRRSRASSPSPGSSELKSFGLPLLVGASRKRFIDTVSPAAARSERLGGSIAAHLAGGRERRRHHPRP